VTDSRQIVGRCIGCFHDFSTGPCGGCGAVKGKHDTDRVGTESHLSPEPKLWVSAVSRRLVVEAAMNELHMSEEEAEEWAQKNLMVYPVLPQ